MKVEDCKHFMILDHTTLSAFLINDLNLTIDTRQSEVDFQGMKLIFYGCYHKPNFLNDTDQDIWIFVKKDKN